jgi:hypothetical protein
MHSGLVPRLGAVLLAAFSAFGSPARAEEPVLSVTGLADGAELQLTLDDLREMGATDLQTGTPWSEGVSTFTGVTGRRFVEALQAGGTEVAADAINNYHIAIPFDVFASDELLIAFARDGQPMSVREKGPLWIIFPYDSDPIYHSDTYKAYSIWSLTRLEFR